VTFLFDSLSLLGAPGNNQSRNMQSKFPPVLFSSLLSLLPVPYLLFIFLLLRSYSSDTHFYLYLFFSFSLSLSLSLFFRGYKLTILFICISVHPRPQPRPKGERALNAMELHLIGHNRIDDFLSGGPGSACRPSRCLVWRRGHRGRSVSRGSRAGAGRPASWCVAAGPSRSRMDSTPHLFDAGALRRIPPRSGSQGFGPVGGLAMREAV
jgi:hypothetical protein